MSKHETLADLEAELGPPDEFLPNVKNLQALRRWALVSGLKQPVEVYAMTPVDLTNLYHNYGDKIKNDASELQRIGADILTRVVDMIHARKIDPESVRAIVQQEIENLPTRKIEIITGIAPSVILDGPQHHMTETILRIVGIGHNIMLVGPAGCGKTMIGKMTATALNLPFYITSTINETHELTGYVDGLGKYHSTAFREAFVNGGIWLADEIDAWDASALLAANSALANGFCRFPDHPAPMLKHPTFRAMASANTFGHGADRVYVGRNQLDAASLDRFAVVPITYDTDLERSFAGGNIEWLSFVWHIRKQVEELKIRHVVSSRAIINGAQGLAAGLSREDVEEFYVWKGMTSKDRDKIKRSILV